MVTLTSSMYVLERHVGKAGSGASVSVVRQTVLVPTNSAISSSGPGCSRAGYM